jgi:hypothetical protein
MHFLCTMQQDHTPTRNAAPASTLEEHQSNTQSGTANRRKDTEDKTKMLLGHVGRYKEKRQAEDVFCSQRGPSPSVWKGLPWDGHKVDTEWYQKTEKQFSMIRDEGCRKGWKWTWATFVSDVTLTNGLLSPLYSSLHHGEFSGATSAARSN